LQLSKHFHSKTSPSKDAKFGDISLPLLRAVMVPRHVVKSRAISNWSVTWIRSEHKIWQ